MQLKSNKKKPKLRGRTRELASRFVAEEIETHKYPRKQAIAIGLSRARQQTKVAHHTTRLRNILTKYK
jgi:hypothetical protein